MTNDLKLVKTLKCPATRVNCWSRDQEDRPPFLDVSCLKSKTVQILLASTSIGSFGIHAPLYYLVSTLTEQSNRKLDCHIVANVGVSVNWNSVRD